LKYKIAIIGNPNAEYVIPRMLNTTISPIENERVENYAKGLRKTIKHFVN